MSIAVIGAGSWGTVLSKILADNGHDVVLWARNPEKAALIEQTRINNDYLPDLTLSPSIHVTHDFQWVGTAEVLVFVVPSKGMGTVCSDLSRVTKGKGKILLTCTKGFSRETGKLMSDVLERYFPEAQAIAALSGPNLAKELAQKQPSASVIASKDPKAAKILQDLFLNGYFRPYISDDILGVQLCGALKNCYALVTGMISGLGLGENSQAALITRALAEMTRLGLKLGAHQETFAGLSGIGDLVATCTSPLSRNHTAGTLLAQGKAAKDIEQGTHMVIEGLSTTKTVYALSHRLGVEMPIIDQLYEVLYHHKEITLAAHDLMSRSGKKEWN